MSADVVPADFDLDQVSIPVPCDVPWESMSGDDRRRFCGACKLHVYDLSRLSRSAAESLIRRKDGDVCVQLYRRPDGRVATQSCREVLVRAARRTRVALLAALGLLVSGAAAFAHRVIELGGLNAHRAWEAQPLATIEPLVPDDLQPDVPLPQLLRGKICLVPTPPAAPPAAVDDPPAGE